MPQAGTIFRVLVASPEDCDKERQIVPEVIHHWNALHSRETGAILEPVRRETHATPELGNRPQGIINRQLGARCDLLVGTFWTRLGTPTGVSESGTVEEIKEFQGAQKPVLLYFSQIPHVPDLIDRDQLEALLAFKDRMKSEGLFFSYSSHADLRSLLLGHLVGTISRIHAGPAPREAEEPHEQRRGLRSFREDYESFLRRLEATWTSERDSEPYGVEEGKQILRIALDEVLGFRSRVIKGLPAVVEVLDSSAKRLRELQRRQMIFDGGATFARFWADGSEIIEQLKSAVEPMVQVESHRSAPSG